MPQVSGQSFGQTDLTIFAVINFSFPFGAILTFAQGQTIAFDI
jgi:hypothetical protein